MTEADPIRSSLDKLCDELRPYYDVADPVWDLIDNVYNGVDRLERKAYLFIPIPGFLQRRRATA